MLKYFVSSNIKMKAASTLQCFRLIKFMGNISLHVGSPDGKGFIKAKDLFK